MRCNLQKRLSLMQSFSNKFILSIIQLLCTVNTTVKGGRRDPTRNAFSRYRTPPCTSFVDRELVPQAKSSRSTNATFNPLDAASSAHPAPEAPPPIINTSNFRAGCLSAEICSCRDGIRGNVEGSGNAGESDSFWTDCEVACATPTAVTATTALSAVTLLPHRGLGW